MEVSCELVRLDSGWFSLSLGTGPIAGKQGLPAARVSLPPGPGDPRQTISVSTFRGDGWLTVDDEPALVRVASGGSEVLVTSIGIPPMVPTPSRVCNGRGSIPE